MSQKLEEVASRNKREPQEFCIILADVDKFKRVNDTFGHHTGDFVLQELVTILKENVRLEDSIARWGGEEFLFLLNAANLDSGVLVAEKLRKAIEDHIFQYEDIIIPVTMTFGVSTSGKDLDIKNLINKADENLYKGKHSTRNCVVS